MTRRICVIEADFAMSTRLEEAFTKAGDRVEVFVDWQQAFAAFYGKRKYSVVVTNLGVDPSAVRECVDEFRLIPGCASVWVIGYSNHTEESLAAIDDSWMSDDARQMFRNKAKLSPEDLVNKILADAITG